MAWYTDEQYETIKDSREKKSVAASAFKQRTHCGRGGRVRLPSDNMTKKELNAMNGECKTYRLGSPMSWDEFKSMPEEHQKTYIKLLRQKYDVPDVKLAEAMGVNRQVFGNWIRCLGLGQGKGAAAKARWWDSTEFTKWWYGVDEVKKNEEAPAEEVNEDAVEHVLSVISEAAATVSEELYDNKLEHTDKKENQSIADKVESVETESLSTAPIYGPGFGPGYTYDDLGDTLYAGPGPVICTTPYMPVIPKNCTMTFENNDADDALATIKALLSNVRVNITISWECVNE